MVGEVEVLPDSFSTRYESVIVDGEVEEVSREEKEAALEVLVRKCAPIFIEKGREYIKNSWDEVRVFKMKISTLSGKARR